MLKTKARIQEAPLIPPLGDHQNDQAAMAAKQ